MSVPPNSLPCLLCGGLFIFPGPRYEAHLQNEHGVMYDVDFLIKVSQHKKHFSKVPIVPSPKVFSESSSQTVERRECNFCRNHENVQISRNFKQGVVSNHNGIDVKNEVDDTVVVRPEFETNVDDENISFQSSPHVSKPLATDMHCYFNCGEVFKKGYDLQLHIKLRHREEDPVERARAEEAAKFEIALTKRSACLYKCALCEKIIEGWSNFWEHLRKHKISVADYKSKYGSTEIKTVKFRCRICDKVMKHECGIIRCHLQMVHGINWSNYLARIRQEMKGIKQEPLPDLVKKEYCKICGESIKYMKQHFKNTHGITTEQYDLLLSDAGDKFKVFDMNQNHRGQTKVNKSDNKSPSALAEASSKSSSSSLPKPSKAEMSDKKVKHCSVCQVLFEDRRHFIEHCQTVHNIKFKVKSSQGLGKGAPCFQQVDKHDSSNMMSMKGSSQCESSAGKFSKIIWPEKRDTIVCKKCEEKFPSWKHLDQHTKFVCKKVKCEFCGKTYSNAFNLRKHIKLTCTSVEKPLRSRIIARGIVDHILATVFSVSGGPREVFDCTVVGCGQQFGRKVHLRRHLGNYHNQ